MVFDSDFKICIQFSTICLNFKEIYWKMFILIQKMGNKVFSLKDSFLLVSNY